MKIFDLEVRSRTGDLFNSGYFLEAVDDKNQGDQGCKGLFGITCDVLDAEGAVSNNDDNAHDTSPETDPPSKLQILHTLLFTKVAHDCLKDQNRTS